MAGFDDLTDLSFHIAHFGERDAEHVCFFTHKNLATASSVLREDTADGMSRREMKDCLHGLPVFRHPNGGRGSPKVWDIRGLLAVLRRCDPDPTATWAVGGLTDAEIANILGEESEAYFFIVGNDFLGLG